MPDWPGSGFMLALSVMFKSSKSGGRTNKYGQFVLAVDNARDDPDELFDRAHAAEKIGDICRSRATLSDSYEKRSD